MASEINSSSENPRLDTQSALTLIHSSFTSKANAEETRRHYAGLPSCRDFRTSKKISKAKVAPLLGGDYVAMELKPRFEADALEAVLVSKVVMLTQKETLSNPIEFLESQLYSLTRAYVLSLGARALSFTCLNELHHIYQLKHHEEELSPQEVEDLNLNLEFLLEEDPAAHEAYKIFKGLVAVCSGLFVHWGLWQQHNYSYRTSGRSVNVPLLDLAVLNEDVMTVETFWFCQAVRQPPLSAVTNEAVKQYSIILESETHRVFSFLVHLNAVDFRKQPSIDMYLAARVPAFRTKLHVEPDYEARKPVYQELSLPQGCLQTCCHVKTHTNAKQLKAMIADLEFAYRSFERSLIGNLLALRKPMYSQ